MVYPYTVKDGRFLKRRHGRINVKAPYHKIRTFKIKEMEEKLMRISSGLNEKERKLFSNEQYFSLLVNKLINISEYEDPQVNIYMKAWKVIKDELGEFFDADINEILTNPKIGEKRLEVLYYPKGVKARIESAMSWVKLSNTLAYLEFIAVNRDDKGNGYGKILSKIIFEKIIKEGIKSVVADTEEWRYREFDYFRNAGFFRSRFPIWVNVDDTLKKQLFIIRTEKEKISGYEEMLYLIETYKYIVSCYDSKNKKEREVVNEIVSRVNSILKEENVSTFREKDLKKIYEGNYSPFEERKIEIKKLSNHNKHF